MHEMFNYRFGIVGYPSYQERDDYSRNLQRDLVYLSDIDYINHDCVGDLIGEGAGRRVYAYNGVADQEQVLKVPKYGVLRPTSPDHIQRKIDLLTTFFPNHFLGCRLMTNNNRTRYCLLQPRLRHFEYLTSSVIEKCNGEFGHLVSINRDLIRNQGLSLDFLGSEGIFSCLSLEREREGLSVAVMTNVVLDETQPQGRRLKILDIGIYRLDYRHRAKNLYDRGGLILHWPLYLINRGLIYYHFGIDIA